MQDKTDARSIEIPDVLPVLPLRDAVLFPYIILPLSVSRDKSVIAVDRALSESRVIMLVAQRDGTLDDPGPKELFEVGTAALIMRMLKLPDGRIRILVQGLTRARIEHQGQVEPFLQARVKKLSDRAPGGKRRSKGALEVEALVRSVKENLDRAINLGKSISPEVMVIAANLDEPGRLADLATSNLELELKEAQAVLETLDPISRLKQVNDLLAREIEVLTMQQEISSQARGEMDRSQREYFLRQQLRAIQEELGEGQELSDEVATYRKAAQEKEISTEACEEMERQIRRLERSQPESAETTLIRTYLDWLTGLPWKQHSQDHLDLDHAREVLDRDHYDLDLVKERILEYLAVRKLKPEARGPILCFVGPPGVGKTSLGRSIAEALGRKFARISLGGVRDEAEIRGHRRTYVGALPGRIIQGINQAGTANPVFMLDEIDKIGSDYRGDPSSAMLEVLDPEQNHAFSDHFLAVPYDLSPVMFIATANLLDPIHPAFLDRMEVIRLSGYTAEEKLAIARRHLVPRQTEAHGLSRRQLRFTQAALRGVIGSYTREAGLRNLERELAKICRKVAVRVARGETARVSVGADDLQGYLGAPKHRHEELLDKSRIGVAAGLAWTEAGGDLMFIEAVAVPGTGKLQLTGRLGEVMRESAQTALSCTRSHAQRVDRSPTFFTENDLHIHAPAGAIPKDGPSAGITIAMALISVLTGRPIKNRVAMTGEITLRGQLLPVGGLKEKLLAARLAGIRTVIVPAANIRDLEEIPEKITGGLDLRPAETLDQVLDLALLKRPRSD